MKRPNSILITLLSLLIWPYDALACMDGTVTIANGEMARSYGIIAAALTFGTIYLQIRRCGFAPMTFALLGMFIPIVFFNDGWHFSGVHGDCGYRERENALQSCYFIAALLLCQIGIGLLTHFRRQRALSASTP